MVALISFAAVAAATIVYLLPFIVAFTKRRPGWSGLLILNILIGWTVIGWLAVLFWAASDPPPPKARSRAHRFDWRAYLRDFGRAKIEAVVFDPPAAASKVAQVVPEPPEDRRIWIDAPRERDDSYADWLTATPPGERR